MTAQRPSDGIEVQAKTPRAAASFLMRLARSLHLYGTPAHRLEQALEAVSERLGIEGQYLVTPTSIVASIGPAESPQTLLERVEPGGVDLGKLTELHALIRDVTEQRVDLETARLRLDEVRNRPRTHGPLATVISFGLTSAAAAVFFDGGRAEVLAAGAIGLVVGLLVEFATRTGRLALVLPAIAALAASILAGLLGYGLDGLFPFIPTLAGLIILIPGLTLTIAVNELAYGHLVSGTARLTGALMAFLQIGFGVALGNKIVQAAVGTTTSSPPQPLSLWTLPLAIAVTAVGLTVLFRARTKDLGVLLVVVATSFTASRLGTHYLGPELGVLVGAWIVGTLGYLLAHWRGVPSAVGILPGILPLVPGSLGFRSLSALLANDVVSGIQAGFTMILMALSLVAGLLLASLARRRDDHL